MLCECIKKRPWRMLSIKMCSFWLQFIRVFFWRVCQLFFQVSLVYLGPWKGKFFYKMKPYYCVQFWDRCCMLSRCSRWKANINIATAVLSAVTNLRYSITYCLRFYAAKHVIFCWKNICYNFILVIYKGLLRVHDKWIATCSLMRNIVRKSW